MVASKHPWPMYLVVSQKVDKNAYISKLLRIEGKKYKNITYIHLKTVFTLHETQSNIAFYIFSLLVCLKLLLKIEKNDFSILKV